MKTTKKKALAANALKVPPAEIRYLGATQPANFNDRVYRGVFSPAELVIIDHVQVHGVATLKELAATFFNGDALKAKNAVRRPRWSGLIAFGDVRGSYIPGSV